MSASDPSLEQQEHQATAPASSSSDEAHAAVAAMKPAPLVLIVAASTKNGIGKAGGLPWSLRSEMQYFSRVTRRVPPPTSAPPSSPASTAAGAAPPARNAVVMGRRTWESIPPARRPLKGRTNVVLSRSTAVDGLGEDEEDISSSGGGVTHHRLKGEDVILASSLEAGLNALQLQQMPPLGRAFIIGGGSVYAAALRMREARHVLLTRVQGEYECDAFFPLDLDGEEARREGWARGSKEELEAFVGEAFDGAAGGEEGDVEFEYCLYERR